MCIHGNVSEGLVIDRKEIFLWKEIHRLGETCKDHAPPSPGPKGLLQHQEGAAGHHPHRLPEGNTCRVH